MSEHHLYGVEWCSAFKQVCCEGMAECVWGYLFCDSGVVSKATNNIEYHNTCERLTASVDEYCARVFFVEQYVGPVNRQPVFYGFHG